MAKRARTDGEEAFSDEAQTGLDSIRAEGPIWTHFPNSQRTRLRYRSTRYSNNKVNWKAHKVPYGNDDYQTATDLTTTGGGATTQLDLSTLTYGNENIPTNYDFNTPYLIQLRMTSPYNIIKSMGTLNSGTVSEPTWISLWDGMYQYYQCKETDWGVTFRFGQPQASNGTLPNNIAGNPQNYKLKIFYRYTNQDEPPTKFTYNTAKTANMGAWYESAGGGQIPPTYSTEQAVTTANETINLTSDDYERMGGWKVKTVSWNTTHSTECHIGGKYTFGQCKMDIKTLLHNDASGAQANPTAEGMSLTRATPQFPEILSIIIVNDAASNLSEGVACNFSVQTDMSQQIDFCDLRAGFKFPTPNLNTVSSYVFTPEQYFLRGAAYS